MKKQRNLIRLACPHCGGYLRIRSSETVNAVSRTATVHCTSDECGFRGGMVMHMTHTLTPSMTPAPGVRLPLSPRVRDYVLAQVMPEIN